MQMNSAPSGRAPQRQRHISAPARDIQQAQVVLAHPVGQRNGVRQEVMCCEREPVDGSEGGKCTTMLDVGQFRRIHHLVDTVAYEASLH